MLRLAKTTDENALLPIYTHEAVERFLTYDDVDARHFAGIFKALLESGSFFVYEVDGAIVGFCKATRLAGRANHVAHLGPLAVSPLFHGQGHAAAMMKEVIARLERDGVLRIELQVEADNPRGIAFYRKVGFEQESVQRKAYKRASDAGYVDEVMMVMFVGTMRADQ